MNKFLLACSSLLILASPFAKASDQLDCTLFDLRGKVLATSTIELWQETAVSMGGLFAAGIDAKNGKVSIIGSITKNNGLYSLSLDIRPHNVAKPRTDETAFATAKNLSLPIEIGVLVPNEGLQTILTLSCK